MTPGEPLEIEPLNTSGKHAFQPIELLERGGYDREAVYTQLMAEQTLSRKAVSYTHLTLPTKA